MASFYAQQHEGHRTASGAPYHAEGMTCAHRTLPFGTMLRVIDLDSGRSVVVKVTDRGPFVRGRIVDLSLAAARSLGMVSRGVARVRIERLAPGAAGPSPRAHPAAALARSAEMAAR